LRQRPIIGTAGEVMAVTSTSRTDNREATRRTSVLVVDDEHAIRALLGEGLREEGFAVTTARSAEDALRLVERDAPDVVLLDLVLPGMGGLDLAHEIHARWPVSIIAMSASTRLLNSARHMPFVRDAIQKPFDWGELVDDLERAVV
jgi:two-component system response regulator MtrA